MSDLYVGGDVFIYCMQFTLDSDDTAVVQNGCDLLKCYVSSFGTQVLSFTLSASANKQHHSEQHDAMYFIVNIVLKILSPETAEMGAVFLGRLMAVVLLHLSNQIVSHLDHILKGTHDLIAPHTVLCHREVTYPCMQKFF